jgi:hypothetical protein
MDYTLGAALLLGLWILELLVVLFSYRMHSRA